jgi:hypothetical protein
MESQILKNNTIIIVKKASGFFVAILLLFFILELYTKVGLVYKISFFEAKYLKSFVFLFFLTALVFFGNRKHQILIFTLSLLFIVSQSITEPSFSKNSIDIFSKFLFTLLVLSSVNYSVHTPKLHLVFRTFEWIMILNSLLIFLGYFLSIKLFSTYQGERFGYNGAFNAVSTGSYAYIITLMYFLLTYKSAVVKNWKFILIFISCFFIGTKAVYLTMAFTLAYIVITTKIPYKKTILTVGAILLLAAAYFFFFQYGIFNSIRQSDGIISALLSYRDELFLERTLPYIKENWSWVNYLFGGVSNFDLRSQMEFIDVFFFWGLLGGAFYLVVFYKLFIPFKLNNTGIIFIAFLAFIILLAGNFFAYSFVALFLLVLKLKLEENRRVF